MKNVLIIAILILLTVLISAYLIREKKKGAACIGCPYSGGCSGGCHSLDDFVSSKEIK
jgi:radical SAM protein with 4Fe4S-binding SPASM domain